MENWLLDKSNFYLSLLDRKQKITQQLTAIELLEPNYKIYHDMYYNLSVRAVNVLHKMDINNLRDLKKLSFDELIKHQNCGKKTAEEIVLFIKNRCS